MMESAYFNVWLTAEPTAFYTINAKSLKYKDQEKGGANHLSPSLVHLKCFPFFWHLVFLFACFLYSFYHKNVEFPMRVIDVHGGITDREIIAFLHQCIADAAHLEPGKYLVAFLDEINAGNVMGVCKSIVVDRILEGKPIPDNVRIAACCGMFV